MVDDIVCCMTDSNLPDKLNILEWGESWENLADTSMLLQLDAQTKEHSFCSKITPIFSAINRKPI
jgi:hypothetical protein